MGIFTGIPMKIPPGAAFGGAPGALRAPGRWYFERMFTESWKVQGGGGHFPKQQVGSGGGARPPREGPGRLLPAKPRLREKSCCETARCEPWPKTRYHQRGGNKISFPILPLAPGKPKTPKSSQNTANQPPKNPKQAQIKAARKFCYQRDLWFFFK